MSLPSHVFSEVPPSSASHTVVKNLSVDPTSDRSGFIVSLVLSSSVPFQASTATHPYRLIIDLPLTSLPPISTLKPIKKLLTSSPRSAFSVIDYNSLALSEENTRLIFTFSKPVVLQNTDTLQGPNGVTLLITLAEEKILQSVETSTSPHVVTLSSQKIKKPLVVLDPGHGGEDPGAETKSGMQEKNIVLEIAQHLKKVLENSGRMDVSLTRSEDVFVPLARRVRMAREMGASLFISLHADALPTSSSVNGLTVYTLSSIASDNESARLAERENISVALGKENEHTASEEIGNILMDFTTRETRMLSISFSEKLIENWRGELSLNKSPIRSANFLVLKAPEIPSVLIELAYLSNAEDIKRISSNQWQRQFITGVERAVHTHLEEKRHLERLDSH